MNISHYTVIHTLTHSTSNVVKWDHHPTLDIEDTIKTMNMIQLETRPNVRLYVQPEHILAVSAVTDNVNSPYKSSVQVGNITYLVIEDIDSILQKLGVTPPVEYKVTPVVTYPRETPKTKKKTVTKKTTKKRR